MSNDVHSEDPKPLVVDVEKPVLLRHATSLAAVVFWPGLILLVLIMIFAHSLFWTALIVWGVLLLVVFAIRVVVVHQYNRQKVRQSVYLRRAHDARTPVGQTTAYGAGIALAADDARIRSKELEPLVVSTQRAVDNANQPSEESQPTVAYLSEAEEAMRQAQSIGATAASDDATKERCAHLWLDAAEGFRLAGDSRRAREASRQAGALNPYILPEEPETPAS